MGAALPVGPADVHDLDVAALRRLQAQAAQAAGMPVFFSDTLADGATGPELAVIPPGHCLCGADAGERRFGDLPRQRVDIPAAFAIGRHALTADAFQAYARDSGFQWPGHLIRAEGRQPVVNISCGQARDYLAWLSAQTGARYRLPSGSEWEYAARAGSLTAYCFGDRLTCGEANIHTVQPTAPPARGWRRFLPFCVPLNRGCEVGSYPANVWGLYEVHGNVWEFTSDAWSGPLDAFGTGRRTPEGDWIVTRGGSWFEGPLEARSASRRPRLRDELDVNLGLRVLRELPNHR